MKELVEMRSFCSLFNKVFIQMPKQIFINNLKNIDDKIVLKNSRFFSNITEIYYYKCSFLTFKGLKYFSNLKSISLNHTKIPKLSELSTIEEVEIFTKADVTYDKFEGLDLKKFHKFHKISKTTELFHCNFKNLVDLRLKFDSKEISHEIQQNYIDVISNTLKLKKLNIETGFNINLNGLTALEFLSVHCSKISYNSIKELSQLKTLFTLESEVKCVKNFVNLKKYWGDYVEFANNNKLKNVILTNNNNQCYIYEFASTLNNLKNSLEILNISAKNHNELKVVSDLTNLKELQISCEDFGEKIDLSKLTKLKKLILNGITPIGGLPLSLEYFKIVCNHEISRNAPIKIYLPNNNIISTIIAHEGVIVENLGKHLTEFISYNKISSKDVDNLMNNKNLTTLEIHYSIPSHIINNNLQNLTTLSLSNFKNQHIIRSLNKLKKLQKLTLNNCNVEPDCIQDLELSEINLHWFHDDLIVNSRKLKNIFMHFCSPNLIKKT
ncbi:hypothetical protein Catovirus_1_581 [Catovirus CTV1]|uniref:Leucine-rich repeat protein n=1 Tax=Catovirus CTV1 TaxID=1977631 RepID=A0A1V0SA14_9VIRU|nr:hypothetical protein Catovirus_1_581 [Catovirus CTV1]